MQEDGRDSRGRLEVGTADISTALYRLLPSSYRVTPRPVHHTSGNTARRARARCRSACSSRGACHPGATLGAELGVGLGTGTVRGTRGTRDGGRGTSDRRGKTHPPSLVPRPRLRAECRQGFGGVFCL